MLAYSKCLVKQTDVTLVTGISASLENMLIFPLFNKSKLYIWDAFLKRSVCQSGIYTFHLISSPSASKHYTETMHSSGLSSIHKPTHSNFKMHNMLGRVSDTERVHIRLNTAAITLNQT